MHNIQLFPFKVGKNPGSNIGSIFRYPGGKKNLISSTRGWILSGEKPHTFVEPFAGSAVTSMAVLRENLADSVFLSDLDPMVANFWEIIASGGAKELCERLLSFKIDRENVLKVISKVGLSGIDLAFQCIVRNRTSHNGILGPGKAGTIGEIGRGNKGISSCWTIRTFVPRIMEAGGFFQSGRAVFVRQDAIKTMCQFEDDPSAVSFIDPPYLVQGSQLYETEGVTYQEVLLSAKRLCGRKLVTYDMVPEIAKEAIKNGFTPYRFPMLSAGGNSGGGFKDELVLLGEAA